MNWAEIFVKLTLRTLFNTPAGLGQIFPVEAQDTQALFGLVTLSAPKTGLLHTMMLLVFDMQAIGHVLPQLVFPIPLHALHIGYNNLAADAAYVIPHFLTTLH